ncbi:MAG: ribosome small subunit-dependent GTPase A [Clostridia bacterium]|jgi:ribosome biogenesis GTPase
METGLITKTLSNQYSVKTDSDEYICKPRGLLRKEGYKLLCGDTVKFEITNPSSKEGYIYSINDRKNSLIRPPVSNIDIAVIVFSLNSPKWDELLVDLLILACLTNGIEPVLCINKSDMASQTDIEDVYRQYSKSGCRIISTDAKHDVGLDSFKNILSKKITVFAGQSGAGKSTLINTLTKTNVMETGELSEKIQRGRNTTRHCELLQYDSGYIVDTPGFSKFDPYLLQPDSIKGMYNEFKQYNGMCRFSDCKHINEKDCAVIRAIEKEEIPIERHNRYKIIYNMSKEALKIRRGY